MKRTLLTQFDTSLWETQSWGRLGLEAGYFTLSNIFELLSAERRKVSSKSYYSCAQNLIQTSLHRRAGLASWMSGSGWRADEITLWPTSLSPTLAPTFDAPSSAPVRGSSASLSPTLAPTFYPTDAPSSTLRRSAIGGERAEERDDIAHFRVRKHKMCAESSNLHRILDAIEDEVRCWCCVKWKD